MCKLTGCQRIAIEARFLSHTKKLPNGCRVWIGAQTTGGAGKEQRSRGGPYGSFSIGRDAYGNKHNSKRAHIVSAFLMGIIPELKVPAGFHLDHTCESGTLCVSCLALVPDHVNLKKRWTRPKAQTAKEVVLDVSRERSARRVKTRRRPGSAARQRRPGNSQAAGNAG